MNQLKSVNRLQIIHIAYIALLGCFLVAYFLPFVLHETFTNGVMVSSETMRLYQQVLDIRGTGELTLTLIPLLLEVATIILMIGIQRSVLNKARVAEDIQASIVFCIFLLIIFALSSIFYLVLSTFAINFEEVLRREILFGQYFWFTGFIGSMVLHLCFIIGVKLAKGYSNREKMIDEHLIIHE